jgi:hypothetical protein
MAKIQSFSYTRRMKQIVHFRGLAVVLLLTLGIGSLPLASWAQDAPESADGAPAWTVSASLMAYWLPDDDQFTSPTVNFDRGKLHLEARYNYESFDTASVWMGYNSSFGDSVSVDFTPMIGLVTGDISGIAPGYHLTVGWRAFEFYSEGEYVFDQDDSSDSYFYSWSEMSWYPVDWLRLGLAGQRTRVYKTERDIQRGFLIGVSLRGISLGAYVFNPDDDDPTYIASLAAAF